jgi:hypothetical protein
VPLFALLLAVSPFHWVKMNWAVPAYPTALLAAAALFASEPRRWRRVAWPAAGLAAFGTVYLLAVPLVPALPFSARDEGTSGWKELAARIAEERRGDPPTPVVGCFYRTASTLAFYLPDRPETFSSNAFGEPGLAYDYWEDPARIAGREVLVVLDERDRGWCLRREELCRPLEPLPPLEIRRGTGRVTTFRIWRCGYLGPPGRAAAR